MTYIVFPLLTGLITGLVNIWFEIIFTIRVTLHRKQIVYAKLITVFHLFNIFLGF